MATECKQSGFFIWFHSIINETCTVYHTCGWTLKWPRRRVHYKRLHLKTYVFSQSFSRTLRTDRLNGSTLPGVCGPQCGSTLPGVCGPQCCMPLPDTHTHVCGPLRPLPVRSRKGCLLSGLSGLFHRDGRQDTPTHTPPHPLLPLNVMGWSVRETAG